jgi:hypothetical protein
MEERVPQVRAALVEYFLGKAGFRRSKAEQYPDVRNIRCADSLEQVAAYIAALSDDDRTLSLFARSPGLFVDWAVFLPPRRTWDGDTESESDLLAFRCGFHRAIGSAAEWFAGWVELVKSEAAEGEMWLELEK